MIESKALCIRISCTPHHKAAVFHGVRQMCQQSLGIQRRWKNASLHVQSLALAVLIDTKPVLLQSQNMLQMRFLSHQHRSNTFMCEEALDATPYDAVPHLAIYCQQKVPSQAASNLARVPKQRLLHLLVFL